jgi:hypothetical protein
MRDSTSFWLGVAAVVMGLLGIAALISALLTGHMRVAMRGGSALELTTEANPILFWFYFFVTLGLVVFCTGAAVHFLSGWF